jgi:hypothetical protein
MRNLVLFLLSLSLIAATCVAFYGMRHGFKHTYLVIVASPKEVSR